MGGGPLSALLWLRVRMWRNTLVRGTRAERRRALGALVGLVVAAVAVGWLARAFFEPLVYTTLDRPDLERALSRIPSFALFTALWMLLLSGVTVGVQVLFLAGDMPLLLTAPLRRAWVYTVKLGEATAANAGLFLVLGGPTFWSFATARGDLGPVYVAQLVLVMAAFAVLPTAIGLLLSLLLMRVLPAGRTRDLLAAAGFALFAVIYVLISIGLRRVSDPRGALDMMDRIDAVLAAPLVRVGPWAWAGDTLSGTLTAGEAWMRTGWLWLTAIAASALAVWACSALHGAAWSLSHEAPTADSGRRKRSTGRWERRLGSLPGPVRAVLLKDLRTLRRDQRQLSMLLIPLAVICVYLVNVGAVHSIQALPVPVVLVTLFVLVAPIALRLSMSAFVTEGSGMALAAASPAPAQMLLTGKLLYAYAITLPVAGVATAYYGWLAALPAGEAGFALALMAVAMAGMCGIGVGSTAYFADFGAATARFVVPVAARLATFGLQLAYTIAVGLVVGAGWALSAARVGPEPLLRSASLLLAALLTAGVVAGSLALASRRLAAREW